VTTDLRVATVEDAPPDGATSARVGRFPCFDGLRAIAALTVLVYHVCVTFDAPWLATENWSWITRFGNFGVSVFFLISGFLLYRPYVVAHFEGRPVPALLPFWRRRFLRIFPAYWVALSALFFIVVSNPINGPTSFVTYYGLIQNYRYGYILRGLGIAWTLVIEVSFYLALPFLAWAIRSLRPRGSLRDKLVTQLGGLAFLYVLAVVVRVWQLWFLDIPEYTRGDWFPLSGIAYWLIGYLDWFALGMALAVGSAWAAKGGRLPRVLVALGNHPWVAWFLALELFWVAFQLNIPAHQGALLTEWQFTGISFFYGLVALFLLIPAVFGPQDRGYIRAFLRSRVMVSLGVISYGIYLWHIIYVKQTQRWTLEGTLPKNLWVWFGVVVVLTLATATVSWFVLERPIIRWSHRPRLPLRRPAAPPAE